MDAETRQRRIAEFFSRRFPRLEEDERIEIRAFRQGQKFQRFYATPAEAAQAIVGLEQDWDVYYGLNPRRGENGTKAGVACVWGLWADADDKHYQGDRDRALAACFELGLDPTFMVRSGHGWQPVWQFAEPLSRAEIARVERTLRRLYLVLGGLDSVQDVSRIFRVPYTWNNKDKGHPLPVDLTVETGPTYTIEQIEALLPALPPSIADQPSEREVTEYLGDDNRPSLAFIAGLLKFIEPTLPYSEFALCWAVIAYYYPGDEGLDLVDRWSTEAREAAGQFSTARTQPEKHRGFRRQIGRIATLGTLIHYAKKGGWTPPEKPPLPNPIIGKRPVPPPTPLPTLPSPEELPYYLHGIYRLVQPLEAGLGPEMILQMSCTAFSCFWSDKKMGDLPSNLWAMGIAPSGTGKSRLTDSLGRFVGMVANRPMIFNDGTPEGMLRALEGEGKSMLVLLDEFGDFLDKMGKDYMSGIAGELCRLHDGRDVHRRLAKSELIVIDPFVSQIATTTPVKIGHLKAEDLSGGLLGRYWITMPKTRKTLDVLKFRFDVAAARALASELDQHILALGGVRHCAFYTPEPPSYRRVATRLGYDNDGWRSYDDEKENPSAPTGRNLARFIVLAILMELANRRPQCDAGLLIVSEESCLLAERIIVNGIGHGAYLYHDLSMGEHERGVSKVTRWLQRNPQGGTKSALLTGTHLPARDLGVLLDVMEDARLIEKGLGSGGVLVWRMVEGMASEAQE